MRICFDTRQSILMVSSPFVPTDSDLAKKTSRLTYSSLGLAHGLVLVECTSLTLLIELATKLQRSYDFDEGANKLHWLCPTA
jgi:hypothetical protein